MSGSVPRIHGLSLRSRLVSWLEVVTPTGTVPLMLLLPSNRLVRKFVEAMLWGKVPLKLKQ